MPVNVRALQGKLENRMAKATYIFVDGGYLLRQHEDVTTPWFGTLKQMDLRSAVRGLINAEYTWVPMENQGLVQTITKAFYYDCLIDQKKTNQTAEELQKQVEEQRELLQQLREVDDCHIRLGSLKGPKRQQKEVDVLIAVDMMAHAARSNMDKVILVTGDLDLRPAVEALVQLGVSVQIAAYAKTTSTELTWAASAFRKLSFDDFYSWTNEQARSEFPAPRQHSNLPGYRGMRHVKDGLIDRTRCALYEYDEGHIIHVKDSTQIPKLSGRSFSHSSLDRLELYFRIARKPIVWIDEAQKLAATALHT
jgi:uncharacterized LabA/DUF88 family protein